MDEPVETLMDRLKSWERPIEKFPKWMREHAPRIREQLREQISALEAKQVS